MPPDLAAQVVTGPSIEKSIAPLRSFVTEPMRYGQLFLVGDAAHIVPPTGAKGLNLAMSDVYYLWRALVGRYRENSERLADRYSEVALKRVWDTARFSWWVTTLLHRFPDQTDFDTRTRLSELQYLSESPVAMHQLAEQYGGFPIEDWG
jgi:p-hydroxybenzoate 3-monooxygenase